MSNICDKHIDQIKQSELMKYVSSYNMTFDDILLLISKGIKNVVKDRDKSIMNGAFIKGLYLGCPGKDIYIALMKMDLSDDQMHRMAKELTKVYPTQSGGHVHTAACIRYIYGCFDKHGCLLSKKHTFMMNKDTDDWSLSDKFMNMVVDEFKNDNNKYGLIIYYEMKAHRIGDKAVMNNDPSYLDCMLEHYIKSQSIAVETKCYKHTFTPFYWAAKYFQKFDKSKAIKYHVKSLKFMNKFCPDSRPGYREKALDSMIYLRKNMSKVEWGKYKLKIKNFRNKCLVKVKGKALK